MLKLAAMLATLAHMNVRVEKVGRDKHRPAVDLKFSADIPNGMLDDLHPGLLNSLYKRPDEQGHQGDLTAPDPATLTTPRYPRAKPWASTEDWPGYNGKVRIGEFADREVPLNLVTLKGITVEAKNGGTAVLTFTCSGYPEGAEVGLLYADMLGHKIELDLDPPSIGDLERLRKEQAASGAAGNGQGGAPEGGDDDQDDSADTGQQAAGRAFPDAMDGRGDKPPSSRRKSKATAAGASVH